MPPQPPPLPSLRPRWSISWTWRGTKAPSTSCGSRPTVRAPWLPRLPGQTHTGVHSRPCILHACAVAGERLASAGDGTQALGRGSTLLPWLTHCEGRLCSDGAIVLWRMVSTEPSRKGFGDDDDLNKETWAAVTTLTYVRSPRQARSAVR
jgi:hypothetical protein